MKIRHSLLAARSTFAALLAIAATPAIARAQDPEPSPVTPPATAPEAQGQTPVVVPAPATKGGDAAVKPAPVQGQGPDATGNASAASAGGAAAELAQPATIHYAPGDRSAGNLAPKFSEEYFPGEQPSPDVMNSVGLGHGLSFALHGYFRAPMRLTWRRREDGSTKPNEGNYDYRPPYLIDDDYYRSGFAYLPINEQDFTELYLSVGNEALTATIALQGSLYSDSAQPLIDKQLGISQGWLTYRYHPDLRNIDLRIRVKAGAFWDRFGYMPKYDTYLFGRTHQVGEQVKVDIEKGDLNFWLTHGVGIHQDLISSRQGMTLLHYASVGAGYKHAVELGLYFLETDSRDKRPLAELTDSNMNVVGADLRVDTKVAGRGFIGTSYLKADQATYTTPALEIMHSSGGRGITENYLGPQSDNGTGSMWNVGLQYDISVASTLSAATGKPSPLPFHGDVTATIFGLYSFIQSKQVSPDPLVNRDDHKSFKWGGELGWRIAEPIGISARYDRVVLDVNDSANSYRVISPKISLFTSFITHEQIFLQYARYASLERVRLRTGQVQFEQFPDDHVIKLQAQIAF